ncbi:sensor histidine kinase [Paramicrobacterium chengjingii]|uniref:sensor histidine kinase n=1 Tax=Paramicrobacterium chengjingii TaxID=2769067 RepID=UPI001423DD36|nr:histidine kinase [Microbacterium chengjingii]
MGSPLARGWAPDLSFALVVAGLGAWETLSLRMAGYDRSIAPLLIVIGVAVAVACARHAGWLSLGLVWVTLVVQIVTATDILLVQATIVVIAFLLARYGSRGLVWASGISLLAATLVIVAFIGTLSTGVWGTRVLRNILIPLIDAGTPWQFVITPGVAAMLAIPWLAGLAMRYGGAARESKRSQTIAEQEALSAEQARLQMAEIAELRESQARLARDVHDVVGHSLTVILAQAESAQFLDGDDALKRTMANIAVSARSSLQEVRAVLASPDTESHGRSDLDELIDATRMSGTEIVVTDTGHARPLPPELAAVAFRVVQEMLTNAIKHGRRESPVYLAREWGDTLVITVANYVSSETTQEPAPQGNGVNGMRRRLESVGGRLDVLADRVPGDGRFTITATLPVRALNDTTSEAHA